MHYFRIVPAAVIASFLLFYATNVLGGIRIEDVMTKEEQKKTGISKLNSEQKKELEAWLTQKFVLRTTTLPVSGVYLSENLDNGAHLRMSDGSLYEVAPENRNISSAWLLPFPLKVEMTQDLTYPYLLIDPNSDERVRAKQIEPGKPQDE